MSTFANKHPSNGTWTTAKLFSFHRHVNQMPRIWYHVKIMLRRSKTHGFPERSISRLAEAGAR